MDNFDIPIFKKIYELHKEFYLSLKNFPKQDRYILGQKIQSVILEILEEVLRAAQTPRSEKLPYLEKANFALNLLRVFFRIGEETKAIDQRKYVFFQEMIDEIGRMLGGWIRSIRRR